MVLKKYPKFDPILAVVMKEHPNTSNKFRFCAIFDFFIDGFTVLF